MAEHDPIDRTLLGQPGPRGRVVFDWTLTQSSIVDTVRLVSPPMNSVPIIFVPGIMGSNLRSLPNSEGSSDAVWRLDGGALWHSVLNDMPVNLAKRWAFEDAGTRQRLLHPERVEVDPDGATPRSLGGTVHAREQYRDRGWGEVAETSYHSFLLWLEQKMNPVALNPALWDDFYYESVSATPRPGERRPEPKLPPGIPMSMRGLPRVDDRNLPTNRVLTNDLLARAQHRFPVYAYGYNWLDTNTKAAELLSKRIDRIIAENNRGQFTCSQVILVTHSMGGLVARACSELEPGARAKIAGIVHGVMPATGAAVAYRRCKVGMLEEGLIPGHVIGATGKEVTAVFAQAPGALQLLPSKDYGTGWLHMHSEHMWATDKPMKDGDMEPVLVTAPMPYAAKPCPYEHIYLNETRWWGLVRKEWLSPKDGIEFTWDKFKSNIKKARVFHESLSGKYHPNTYVYYGNDAAYPSFADVHWDLRRGSQPSDRSIAPSASDALDSAPGSVRADGRNAVYIGGRRETVVVPSGMGASVSSYETSHWYVRCRMQDGPGDGTVPVRSGQSPSLANPGAIRQQFGLAGFDHEGSYKHPVARAVALYSITKIAADASHP